MHIPMQRGGALPERIAEAHQLNIAQRIASQMARDSRAEGNVEQCLVFSRSVIGQSMLVFIMEADDATR